MSGKIFKTDENRGRMGSEGLPEDRFEEELRTVFEEELRTVFEGKTNLDSVLSSAKEVRTCMESPDCGDVCLKLASALNIASMIAPITPLVQFTQTFVVLSRVFQKIGDTLNARTKPSDQDKLYSELQSYQESELSLDAIGLEKALFNNNAFLSKLDTNTPESVINSVENHVPINDIVSFLGKLQAKTRDALQSTDVAPACRAVSYINLYFRLSTLYTLVLWQVFCIKKRSGYDQTSAQGVLAMITECQKNDTELLFSVCEASLEKAMFLTVFHPTENENFLHSLRIHEHKIPSIGQEKSFSSGTHAIRSTYSPDVKLEMSSWFGGCIRVARKNSDACKFKFEPVKGRRLDNIFFLKSMHWRDYYVMMCDDGTCKSSRSKPSTEGHWKLVRLENDRGPPQYVLSPLKWPGRFVYMESVLGIASIKSTYDFKKVKARGVWEILDL